MAKLSRTPDHPWYDAAVVIQNAARTGDVTRVQVFAGTLSEAATWVSCRPGGPRGFGILLPDRAAWPFSYTDRDLEQLLTALPEQPV